MSRAQTILRTDRSKATIIPRVIAGLPLAGINTMHLTGQAPIRPILEGAGVPFVGLNAVLAPLLGLLAGLSLLAGAYVRVGSFLALGFSVVAIYTHLVHDWADEPPIVLPIVILLCAAWILPKGAGAWSVDARLGPPAATSAATGKAA